MKRGRLIIHLESHGCKLLREGSRHSVYLNPTNNAISTVPRHDDINDGLAIKICKDLKVPNPKTR
ncbi:MAG: type II toxin-antitoxin system HicA family toxin [Candidatus Sigynarchaeota archaeon]